MRFLYVLFLLLLVGCSQNPKPFVSPPSSTSNEASTETVFLAAMRTIAGDSYSVTASSSELSDDDHQKDLYLLNRMGEERAGKLVFLRDEISIPNGFDLGESKVALLGQSPNAKHHIAYVSRNQIKNVDQFANEVWSLYGVGSNRVVIFVHGNNVNILEATKRYAKVQQDYGLASKKIPAVTFIGQSSGILHGYAYDRESVRFDRRHLEQLINALTKYKNKKVLLVAHSLGSDFVMETLARLALKNSSAIKDKIHGVILIAPDLSIEVFKSQIEDIKKLPRNFAVLTHTRDRALQFSAFLRSNRNRLGLLGTQSEQDLKDAVELCEKGVTFVNMDDFPKGDLLNHKIPFTSPEAIEILQSHINNKDFIDNWIYSKAAVDIVTLYNKRGSEDALKSGIDFERLAQIEKTLHEKDAEKKLSVADVPSGIVDTYLEQSDSLETSGLCLGSPFTDVRS